MKHLVATGSTTPAYNPHPPYHPHIDYPEFTFPQRSPSQNPPYDLLRILLRNLGYDRERYGTKGWNPLGVFIRPGDNVLLKPNFVTSFHSEDADLFSVVTHPSILRALADYVYLALEGNGKIIIADAPQMDCNWVDLMRIQHMESIQDFYWSEFRFPVEVIDLRNFELIRSRNPAYSTNRRKLPGDPKGEVVVNLGCKSDFYELSGGDYYGADYNREETARHHHGEVHEYCLSRTVLESDVIISIPKMKVHKKVGVTLNLKGFVGANTNKNYLIHYRLRGPKHSGDQYPDAIRKADQWILRGQRWLFDAFLARQRAWGDCGYKVAMLAHDVLIRPFHRVSPTTLLVDGGNWHGNDSAWRMAADLAKILYFSDRNGLLQEAQQRRFFCVVDGIIGGERNGPLSPSPQKAGCLVAGEDPVAVDMVTTRLMGFDIRKIRYLRSVMDGDWAYPVKLPGDITICKDSEFIPGERFFDFGSNDPMFAFEPHPGGLVI